MPNSDRPSKDYIDYEPIMSRRSHGYGLIEFFPPKAAPEKWGSLPWLMRTEKSPTVKAIREKVRAEHVPVLFKRPWLIEREAFRLPPNTPDSQDTGSP